MSPKSIDPRMLSEKNELTREIERFVVNTSLCDLNKTSATTALQDVIQVVERSYCVHPMPLCYDGSTEIHSYTSQDPKKTCIYCKLHTWNACYHLI